MELYSKLPGMPLLHNRQTQTLHRVVLLLHASTAVQEEVAKLQKQNTDNEADAERLVKQVEELQSSHAAAQTSAQVCST